MPIYWTFKTLLDTGRYALRYAVHREEICVQGTGVWNFIKFGACDNEENKVNVNCSNSNTNNNVIEKKGD